MNKNKYEAKVVILGEPSVGKTSILSRYISKSFNENIQATIVGSFAEAKVQIDDKDVILQIWDTAGQELYRSLSDNFIKGSVAVILVFSIIDLKSYEELFNFWTDKVEGLTENVLLYLVANKIDLEEESQIDIKNLDKLFQEEHNGKFFEISAKTNFGISELFTQIAVDYLATEPSPSPEKLDLTKKPEIEKKKNCC